MKDNFAIVIPMANEEETFELFITALKKALDGLGSGKVYIVIDTVSQDRTFELCKKLSATDRRFHTVWAPENRNIADAYLRGFKAALEHNHALIIEMDAGLSHDPASIPLFLEALNNGYQCAFGSRYIKGGSIVNANLWRRFLSKSGTILSHALLKTTMTDMTSGYQGFHAGIVQKIVDYNLLSTAHFYQTELRYLLRNYSYKEIPIQYCSPSPRVSKHAVFNSIMILLHYFRLRLIKKEAEL